MSIATIVGFIGAMGLFLSAIVTATDDYAIFVSLSSLVMVAGGTLAAAFISYEPRYVLLSFKVMIKIFGAPAIARGVLKNEVGRIIKWAYLVQKSGPQALEAEVKKSVKGDKFLKFGIDMVISGYTGEEVRECLNNTIETSFGRNTVLVDIIKKMGAAAPAFGMIGTLVGLIIMLGSMGGDPSTLGAGLAVALCTTLYGVIFSQIIFLPSATKILQREQIIRFRNYLVAEGLVLLADKKSPRFIQDRMNSFLDPAIHFDIDKMKK
ncbi:MAG: MotA/TolQ/ExbB proton channel family protein [Rhodospirillales bacterium]|jgi:chemotaxis protein MotA|nr:MotA/TolQ/ExbB proton channel family protein [Rhodospirillales bacterium]